MFYGMEYTIIPTFRVAKRCFTFIIRIDSYFKYHIKCKTVK